MNTPSFATICLLVLYVFLVFESYLFFITIIPILVDKSFGSETDNTSKLNKKKAVMRSWFFGLFLVAFGYSFWMIKSNENKYLILYGFIAGLVLMFLFHYFPKKISNNNYFKSIENTTPFVKILDELKPSLLNADEIKKQFDSALSRNYFVCEFSQFEDLLKLNNPKKKIIWKPISHRKKMKDRQLLLTFLNNLFQKQLIKIDRKEVCQMVNKYFEFNEDGHHIKENPLKPDNISDWIKKV
jgi:hypothetical protein